MPAVGGYALGVATSVVGSSVRVQPFSNLTIATAGPSNSARSVARALQAAWDSGTGLGGGFAALASIGSSAQLASALSSIGGSAVSGVAATRLAASERFFDNLVSCDQPVPGAVQAHGATCGWMRIVGSQTNLASNDGDPGYHQTATIYQVGGQYEFAPGWFAGASLGFEQNWLTGGGASVNGQAGLAGLTIKREAGPWTLTGAVDGGWGNYHSTRTIVVGTHAGAATASPDVADVGAHAKAGIACRCSVPRISNRR